MTGGGIIAAGGRRAASTGGGLAWATPAAAASTVTTLNEQILLDDEATEAPTPTDGGGAGAGPGPGARRPGHRAVHGGDGALRRVAAAAHRLRQPRHPAVPAQVGRAGVSPGRSPPCLCRMAAISAGGHARSGRRRRRRIRRAPPRRIRRSPADVGVDRDRALAGSGMGPRKRHPRRQSRTPRQPGRHQVAARNHLHVTELADVVVAVADRGESSEDVGRALDQSLTDDHALPMAGVGTLAAINARLVYRSTGLLDL